MTRAAVALLTCAAFAGAGVVSHAYFSDVRTSPQPISIGDIAPPGIKYETVSSPVSLDTTSLSVPAPAGVQPGWLLVATLAAEANPVVTAPSGWTAIGAPIVDAGNKVSLRSFWHTAAAGEPASYTFTLDSKRRAAGGILAYSGVRAANPIDASATGQGKTLAATAPPATATYDTRWIFAAAFHGPEALSFSTQVTQRWQKSTPNETAAVAEAAQPPGATPAATAQGTKPHEWVAQTIVLNAGP